MSQDCNLVAGKDAFDENGFMEGAFGTDAMAGVAAGMVGNMITRGMSQGNIGANGIKVDAFNTNQISQMQGLNSFVGSMASSGVTYAMTDRVTFNVARIAGTGVLEMNVGKGGFSMNLGTGGTDISLGTISSVMSGLSHWNTNLKIEKKAQSLELDIATALRSQYGFGDRNARAQLDSILDGSTDLRQREGSTGEAQTVLENGKRVVYLDDYHDGMSREQQFRMGITLQHEAYRNGIVDKNNKAETQVAAYAHTLMIERVMSDTRYSSLMGTVISRDANLAADLAMLNKARESRDLGVFGSYVDATYDSSADNWRINKDGKSEWDGNLNVYDMNGNDDDPAMGRLLEYTELNQLIKDNEGKETVMLANGQEVRLDELKKIQEYNNKIVDSGTTIFGKIKRGATESLLTDGFMSMNEARDSYQDVISRKIFGSTYIEHMSTRYVLNDNSEFMQMFKDDQTQLEWTKTDQRDQTEFTNTPAAKTLIGSNVDFTLYTILNSSLHGPDNYKWVDLLGGREFILNNAGKFETNPEYMGTFNFSTDNGEHSRLDVTPWIQWGNTPDDPTNSFSRVASLIGNSTKNVLTKGLNKITNFYNTLNWDEMQIPSYEGWF